MKAPKIATTSGILNALKIALRSGEGAQATIEWVLLTGVIIVPTAALIFAILLAMEPFYSLNSWVLALPFP